MIQEPRKAKKDRIKKLKTIHSFHSLKYKMPDSQRQPEPNPEPELSKAQKGIDIKDALAILSLRAKNGDEKGALQTTNPALKKLGQTLDLMNDSEPSDKATAGEGDNTDAPPCCSCGASSHVDETNGDESENGNTEEQQERSQLQQARSKLQNELSKQSPSQNLSTLFKLQKERVVVFKEFNAGLDTVLQSGNLTSYPHLTTNVTASFVVISQSIKAIQQLLERGGNKNIAEFIQQLQNLEKNKLNLTAALHLEKIRERNETLNLDQAVESGADGDSDERILSLLNKGVVDLEKKICICEQEINEVLEELRYAVHDLED